MVFRVIYPEDFPAPYTDSVLGTNLKERKVSCPECHYEIMTDLPGAKCGKCHSKLITVLKRNDIMAQ